MASPILRETIKKLKDRRAQLQREIKGPLAELRQIEQDLAALGAAPPTRARATARRPARARPAAAPRGARQQAILQAIRNGATTPEEIAAKTGLDAAAVARSLAGYAAKGKLVTTGPNGLTLTKAGREKLAALKAAAAD